MEKTQVQIHINDRCPICQEKLMNEDKTLVKSVMASDLIGVVHDGCILPYHREDDIKFLLKCRCYSIGDTIAVTPILREFRRLYPYAKIYMMTFFPDLFKHNPHIQGILDMNATIPIELYNMFVFQADAFNSEKVQGHFAMHSVEYSSVCALNRSLDPKDWDYELYYMPEDRQKAFEIAKENGIDLEKDKLILIHPHKTEWSTRDWGPKHFPELAKRLKEKFPDYKLVSIGGKRSEVPSREMPNYIPIPEAIDLYGKLSLLQSAALMDYPACKLLITPDTGTLHLAATRKELPIVGIFTLVKAVFRTPTRNRKFGYKFIGVESDSDCKCTYTNRTLTNEMNFYKCPKKKFLEDTFDHKIPRKLKQEGLKNLFPENTWSEDQLGRQIQQKLSEFENLPCFPPIDKVLSACERAITTWSH